MGKQSTDHDSFKASAENREPSPLREFEAYLQARGHRGGTIHAYCQAALHYLRWLSEQTSDRRAVSTASVRDFLENHLPVCNCPPPARKSTKEVRAALNQLLRMHGGHRLRIRGARASDQIETSVSAFDAYLRDVAGLAWQTRCSRCRYVRDFLQALFGSEPLQFERIVAEVLVEYVCKRTRHYRPDTVGAVAYALRSYLRFLRFNGDLATDLGDAIPTPPSWSLNALPTSLSEDDLERFWKAFDRSIAIGRRDYAMARCLADMALRCHEVAAIRLDAIDWRSGTLHVPRTKSREADSLPLPESTGQALIDYLTHARPRCTTRSVFVYHRAPLGQAVATTTVRGAIRRAFVRAGLPWTGTHILRRTAATRMRQSGTSLKVIADVLRHQSLDTALIYTKVDLANLTRVALPWPEQRS